MPTSHHDQIIYLLASSSFERNMFSGAREFHSLHTRLLNFLVWDKKYLWKEENVVKHLSSSVVIMCLLLPSRVNKVNVLLNLKIFDKSTIGIVFNNKSINVNFGYYSKTCSWEENKKQTKNERKINREIVKRKCKKETEINFGMSKKWKFVLQVGVEPTTKKRVNFNSFHNRSKVVFARIFRISTMKDHINRLPGII